MNTRRRVGIFGGTFDPPHMAHVVLAAAAVEQLDLDLLLVTVAGVPWQKVGERIVSPGDVRLAMAHAAFDEVEAVEVSDMELRRSGNSYTVETLEAVTAEDTDLFLLLGSDAASGLDTWERHGDVAALASIAVFPRRGHENALPPPGFVYRMLELPGLEISSTDIRDRVRNGRSVAGMVAPRVRALINSHGLYTEAANDPEVKGSNVD